jgi:hypothetical protein
MFKNVTYLLNFKLSFPNVYYLRRAGDPGLELTSDRTHS